MNARLPVDFFRREVLTVAPEMLGKVIVRKFSDRFTEKFIITEVEAYNGVKDLACHASKGNTSRTEVMFREGGVVYVYLIYGMYWMLNVVTGQAGDASAVLVRGVQGISGPGKVGRTLALDKSFYGERLDASERIWIEDSTLAPEYEKLPRVGIEYAGEPWISKPWRYITSPVPNLK